MATRNPEAARGAPRKLDRPPGAGGATMVDERPAGPAEARRRPRERVQCTNAFRARGPFVSEALRCSQAPCGRAQVHASAASSGRRFMVVQIPGETSKALETLQQECLQGFEPKLRVPVRGKRPFEPEGTPPLTGEFTALTASDRGANGHYVRESDVRGASVAGRLST